MKKLNKNVKWMILAAVLSASTSAMAQDGIFDDIGSLSGGLKVVVEVKAETSGELPEAARKCEASLEKAKQRIRSIGGVVTNVRPCWEMNIDQPFAQGWVQFIR